MIYDPADRMQLTIRALVESAYHRGRVEIPCESEAVAQALGRQISSVLRTWATAGRFGNAFGQPSLAAVSQLITANASRREGQAYLSISRRGYSRDWVNLARALPMEYQLLITKIEAGHTGESEGLIRKRLDLEERSAESAAPAAMSASAADAGLDYLTILADSLTHEPTGAEWLPPYSSDLYGELSNE